MPFTKRIITPKGNVLAFWSITETEQDLLNLLYPTVATHELEQRKHLDHRLQWLASRVLWQEFCRIEGMPFSPIRKVQKWPEVQEGFLSLTHSGLYCGLLFSAQNVVGLDLDQYDSRMPKLVKRLSTAEEYNQLHSDQDYLAHWLAKEALYKYYRNPSIDFKTGLTLQRFANNSLVHFTPEKRELSIQVQPVENYLLAFVE